MDDQFNYVGENHDDEGGEEEVIREIADAAGIDEADASMLFEAGVRPEDI